MGPLAGGQQLEPGCTKPARSRQVDRSRCSILPDWHAATLLADPVILVDVREPPFGAVIALQVTIGSGTPNAMLCMSPA
jgi:hypothetical protein